MATYSRTRILIADDHRFLAEVCKKLLEPEFVVVGIVFDGRALVKAAAELLPDVAIVDISMPHLNGLDAVEKIKQTNKKTKVIFLTMNMSPDVAVEAFRRGASGYVVKSCTADELVITVRRAVRGEAYLSPEVTEGTLDALLKSGTANKERKQLSSRQKEVLQLLAEGKQMKEVAFMLQVSMGTIAFHKYRIMKTLAIKSDAELVRYALRHYMLASSPAM